jgi:SAM-dependent methyltransferase
MANYAGIIDAKLRTEERDRPVVRFLGALANMFESPVWVHITRRSRIRQAISHIIAEKRGIAHLCSHEGAVLRPGNSVIAGDSTSLVPVELTAAEITARCLEILREEEIWERFFAENAILPLRFAYEDIASSADYLRLIANSARICLEQLNKHRTLVKMSNETNELAFQSYMTRDGNSTPDGLRGPGGDRATDQGACDTRIEMQKAVVVSNKEGLRFVRTIGIPQVYCIVKGRRRLVPYAEWWVDEGWLSLPSFEIIESDKLLQFPLGPPCPVSVLLNGKSLNHIIDSSDLMRTYLASLVNGDGVEFGAGGRPFPVPLQANVAYADAFAYGCEQSRSFPGVTNFEHYVVADILCEIQTMRGLKDESVDFVLGAHVIEHTPNPIAALVAANRILRKAGKLVLTIPDKRRTLDRVRETTPVSHMVLDYEDYQRKRDLAHYEEWHSRVGSRTSSTARADWEMGADLHYHCFTPASFMELVAVSSEYAEWCEIDFLLPPADTRPTSIEFYAVLSK